MDNSGDHVAITISCVCDQHMCVCSRTSLLDEFQRLQRCIAPMLEHQASVDAFTIEIECVFQILIPILQTTTLPTLIRGKPISPNNIPAIRTALSQIHQHCSNAIANYSTFLQSAQTLQPSDLFNREIKILSQLAAILFAAITATL